jgi:hypothetical protein
LARVCEANSAASRRRRKAPKNLRRA